MDDPSPKSGKFATMLARISALVAKPYVRHRIYMAASTALRMVVAFATFMIVARFLGPQSFGLFSTAIVYGSIAAVVANYGFPTQALKEVGANPSQSHATMDQFFRLKNVLFFVVIGLSAPALWFVDSHPTQLFAAALLFISMVVASYGDLALVAFRGVGDFGRETRVVFITSMMHAALIFCAVFADGSLIAVSAAYCLSRVIYSVYAIMSVRSIAPFTFGIPTSLKDIPRQLRISTPYALDYIVSLMFSQFDAILVGASLGMHAAGQYMAGARLVQGLIPLTTVLGAVQIPVLVRLRRAGDQTYRRTLVKYLSEYLIIGLISSIIILIIGPLIVRFVLGESYLLVNQLWLGFAAFTFARFISAGLGAPLVVAGNIASRIIVTLVTCGFTAALFFMLIGRYDVFGVPWIMAAGMTLLSIFYGVFVWRDTQQFKRSITSDG